MFKIWETILGILALCVSLLSLRALRLKRYVAATALLVVGIISGIAAIQLHLATRFSQSEKDLILEKFRHAVSANTEGISGNQSVVLIASEDMCKLVKEGSNGIAAGKIVGKVTAARKESYQQSDVCKITLQILKGYMLYDGSTVLIKVQDILGPAYLDISGAKPIPNATPVTFLDIRNQQLQATRRAAETTRKEME